MSRLVPEKEFKRTMFHVSLYGERIKNLCEMNHPLAIKRLENFWTVGSASYKDRDKYTKAEYEKFVDDKNMKLLYHFEDLYTFQLQYFEYILKRKCRYMPRVSWPGFHVFKYCEEFTKPIARPHVDVPFNKFDWGKKVGYTSIFTHVVPVDLPPSAGMYVWDVTADDIDEKGYDAVKAEIESRDVDFFLKHVKNQMVMHSGRFAHQIAPFYPGETGTWRITLQSHAILLDNVWNLYW